MNAGQTRIAFLLPSLRFGGAERAAISLADALRQRGYVPEFVLMRGEGDLLEDVAARFSVVNLNCSRTWKLPWLLTRYLKAGKPVALISSFWKLNLCASLARIAAPWVRVVLWEHSPPGRSRNSPPWMYAPTATLVYRFATRVVAVSDGVAEDVRRLTWGLSSRIITIYNPVPAAPQMASSIRPRSGALILWVGRLAEPKNPSLMIDVMANLPAELGARVLVLGDGPQRAELEAKVRSSGLRGRIRFLGFQASPYRFMTRADLLALTSDREGLPTVLIEGLSAGLRLVSTDCAPGVREILMDGRLGAITPVGDAGAFAAAVVKQLHGRPDSAIQRAGARRFDPELIADRFLAELRLPLP